MANQQPPNPPTYSPSEKRPGTFVPNPDESDQQTQRQDSQEQSQTTRRPTHPDRVEIGEPVPEEKRQPRASQDIGETGEDEDLPDAGNREGSRDEQH